MGAEVFKLDKAWAKWASDTSKKIKATGLSKSITDYVAIRDERSEKLKWYQDAIKAIDLVKKQADDVGKKLESDPDVKTQLVLAALDKGASLIQSTKTGLTNDEKKYKAKVDRQKQWVQKTEKFVKEEWRITKAIIVKAEELLEKLPSAQKDSDELATLQDEFDSLVGSKLNACVEASKKVDKELEDAASWWDGVNIDDRATFLIDPAKNIYAINLRDWPKEAGEIGKKIHAAKPPLPKTKAPSLPKKD